MFTHFLGTFRKISWWVILLSILLVGDLVWRCADLTRHRRSLADAERFQVLDLPGEEGGSCVTVVKQKRPVYAECDFGDGKVDAIEFYWHGRTILTLSIKDGSIERGRSLTYYDADGKKTLMLVDHEGDGDFHSRITYGSEKPLMEVLIDGSWKPVQEHGQKKGVVLDGQWFPLEYTNAAWKIARSVNQ